MAIIGPHTAKTKADRMKFRYFFILPRFIIYQGEVLKGIYEECWETNGSSLKEALSGGAVKVRTLDFVRC